MILFVYSRQDQIDIVGTQNKHKRILQNFVITTYQASAMPLLPILTLNWRHTAAMNEIISSCYMLSRL